LGGAGALLLVKVLLPHQQALIELRFAGLAKGERVQVRVA